MTRDVDLGGCGVTAAGDGIGEARNATQELVGLGVLRLPGSARRITKGGGKRFSSSTKWKGVVEGSAAAASVAAATFKSSRCFAEGARLLIKEGPGVKQRSTRRGRTDLEYVNKAVVDAAEELRAAVGHYTKPVHLRH